MIEHLRTIVNRALVNGEFPEEWKDAHVTLLTKKPPAERLQNQRPIALCNTSYKLFSVIVNMRLTRTMEENGILQQEQEGGR